MTDIPSSYILTVSDEIKFLNYPSFAIQQVPFIISRQINDISWNNRGDLLAYTLKGDTEVYFCHLKQENSELVGSFKRCGNGSDQSVLKFSNFSPYTMGSSGPSKISLIWDCKMMAPKQGFQELPGTPICATFSYDDSLFLVGCNNHDGHGVIVFDLTKVANKSAVSYLGLSKQTVVSKIITNSCDKNILGLITTNNQKFCIYDMISDNIVNNFEIDNNKTSVTPIDYTFSPQNKILSIGAIKEKMIFLFDSTEKKVVQTIKTHRNLESICVMDNGTSLLVGTLEGLLLEYDLRNNETPIYSEKIHRTGIKHILSRKNQFNDLSISIDTISLSSHRKLSLDEPSKFDDRSFEVGSLDMRRRSDRVSFRNDKEFKRNKLKKKVNPKIAEDESLILSTKDNVSENTQLLGIDEVKTAINRLEFSLEQQLMSLKSNIGENIIKSSSLKSSEMLNQIIFEVNKDFKHYLDEFYYKINKDITQMHLDIVKSNFLVKSNINNYQDEIERRFKKLEEENEQLKTQIYQLKPKK